MNFQGIIHVNDIEFWTLYESKCCEAVLLEMLILMPKQSLLSVYMNSSFKSGNNYDLPARAKIATFCPNMHFSSQNRYLNCRAEKHLPSYCI